MTQYEKSGPPTEPKTKEQTDIASTVFRLQQQVSAQDRQIRELQLDLRRLKDKMDQHADFLNRQQRG